MTLAVSQEIKDILNPFCKALHEEYEETKNNCSEKGRYECSFDFRFSAENAAVITTIISRILPGIGCYSGGRVDTTKRIHIFTVIGREHPCIFCSEIIHRNGEERRISGESRIIDGRVQIISSI